jgi:hypothetical protein
MTYGAKLTENLLAPSDAVPGFSAILWALLITAVFRPSVAISMVAIGVAFLPVFARLTRASFFELRDREFVLKRPDRGRHAAPPGGATLRAVLLLAFGPTSRGALRTVAAPSNRGSNLG